MATPMPKPASQLYPRVFNYQNPYTGNSINLVSENYSEISSSLTVDNIYWPKNIVLAKDGYLEIPKSLNLKDPNISPMMKIKYIKLLPSLEAPEEPQLGDVYFNAQTKAVCILVEDSRQRKNFQWEKLTGLENSYCPNTEDWKYATARVSAVSARRVF